MKLNKQTWISFGILFGISILAYLPLVHKLGYVNDDWYLMYDGNIGGADYFHEVFRIDRPLRGYVMQTVFSLFGLNPTPYHLSAFVFRLLSAIGFLWLCGQLWPKRQLENLIAAILFLIYPGFLSQVNPIDYQSQIISLACGMFSIALTVKAIRSNNATERWVYIILSVLLAWVYLGLVEYFIGFEVLRLICVLLLFWRQKSRTVQCRLTSAFYAFIPFLEGGGGFLIWRLFFFSAERRATDVSAQLSYIFSSPLTVLWWLNYLIQDVFKVIIAAWVVPLHDYAFSLRLRDSFLGFGVAFIGVLIVLIMFRLGYGDDSKEGDKISLGVVQEKLWVSLATIVACLLPVIVVNRHVVLPDFSRYTLSASTGVAILLSVLFSMISMESLKRAIVVIFVILALQTHYGNFVRVASETESINEFWWQVSWRVPDIKTGTTLAASYSVASIQEDYFVWGPANHIYYPEQQAKMPIDINLSAVVLNEDNVARIIAGKGNESFYRRGDVLISIEFNNVLVMTQADERFCVRVIDGNAPELSVYDPHRIMLIAPNSRLENVQIDGKSHTPPDLIFGPQPLRDWCFYYQKASLARQKGDWNLVVELYEEAEKMGFHPNDQIELMPFLQAYAIFGNQKQVKNISTRINTHTFYRQQACHNLMFVEDNKSLLTSEMQSFVDELFCQ
jgi:hypothetical protein